MSLKLKHSTGLSSTLKTSTLKTSTLKTSTLTASLQAPLESPLNQAQQFWTRSSAAIRALPRQANASTPSTRARPAALATAQVGSYKISQTLKGSLSRTDRRNPLRSGRYADDFALKGLKKGQRVEITLGARKFDAYLELLNSRTGRSLLYGDQTTTKNNNARLVFTAKAKAKYTVRVSSYKSGEAGNYTLRSTASKRANSPLSFYYGSGLVNAAAAVAGAILYETVKPNAQPTFSPVANLGGDRWNLDLVKAPAAWAQGYTGQGITVAVIDDGVDYTHPDLATNIWVNADEIAGNGLDDDGNGFIDDIRGWDFLENDNQPFDAGAISADRSSEHGTHVAGAIAAANNGIGTTGVAYNAKILPIRALSPLTDSDDPRLDTNVANSIYYAVNNGARVINMSLGNYLGDPLMAQTKAALQVAKQAGVVVVVAAGNARQDYGAVFPDEPALYANEGLAIAVGALDINRRMLADSNPAGTTFSNVVVAPGVDVYSTIVNGEYGYLSGTSMSAPHVAGVVALMLSANPGLMSDQVAAILSATANPSGIQVV